MTDGVLKRLAQLERRARRGDQKREGDRPEQRWAEPGEYHAAVRALMVECRLPTWPADTDGTEWLESRGLSAEVVVTRIDQWRADHPGVIARAELKAAVLGTRATSDDKVAAWVTLNGGAA